MNASCFVINKRFVIDPTINVIQDRKQGREGRVEPRLMEVLCFLAHRSNQVVTREELIQGIWKEVGSGEEGLTQAISFLRKTLDDQGRQLIITIPKRGYVLKATIAKSFGQQALQATSQVVAIPSKQLVIPQSTKRVYLPLLLFLCLMGAYLGYVHLGENKFLPASWKVNSNSSSVTDAKPKVVPIPHPTPKPHPH